MTPTEFTAALARLELSQAGFARLVERLSGEPFNAVTVNRWCRGTRRVSPVAVALVAFMERCPNTAHHLMTETHEH